MIEYALLPKPCPIYYRPTLVSTLAREPITPVEWRAGLENNEMPLH